MNATQNTNITGATEILARLNRADNTPIVIVAHTFDGNNVQFWPGKGGELKTMTKPEYDRTDALAKDDEEMMRQRFEKQFKGSQALLRHRLPRQERLRPVLFAVQNNPSTNQAPANLPAPNKSAPAQAATPTPNAPAVNVPHSDLNSLQILEKIKETGGAVTALAQQVATLAEQLKQASADHEERKQQHAVLTAQYHAAVTREMEQERQKREAALAAAMGGDTLQQAAQNLHDNETKAEDAKPEMKDINAAPEAQATPPRGNGGRFTKADNKADAKPGNTGGRGKGKGNAKPIEAATANPTMDFLKALSPEQLQALAAQAGMQPPQA